jgi:hypothetical protein
VGAVILSTVLLVAGCYTPGIQRVLGQVNTYEDVEMNDLHYQWPLNLWDWAQLSICVVIHIALVEIVKLVIRLAKGRSGEEAPSQPFYAEV